MRIIQGHNAYWHVCVAGDDLLVRGVLGSWFGGPSDTQDSGQTASGYPTMGHPTLLACALPIPTCIPCQGSPLPILPYGLHADGSENPNGTRVTIYTPDGLSVTVPLIDVGPKLSTNHGIDLTTATFQSLGGDLRVGLLSVDYRVLGAAKYLP